MTEQEFAFSLRRLLDESTERLPYRVTHRLGAAREAALARMGEDRQIAAAVAPALTTGSELAVAGGPGASRWRIALIVAPLLLLAIGAFTIPVWDDTEKAQETAELDEAVLTDDLPISAYADRGFGVFLRNNRQ